MKKILTKIFNFVLNFLNNNKFKILALIILFGIFLFLTRNLILSFLASTIVLFNKKEVLKDRIKEEDKKIEDIDKKLDDNEEKIKEIEKLNRNRKNKEYTIEEIDEWIKKKLEKINFN